jgi:hypothetical protein
MENALNSLDLDKRYIGEVTLNDGVTKLKVPGITMFKIIKIVKFIGIDGIRIYNDVREILIDETVTELEKVAMAIESLKEEQLIRILSILLEKDDKETLALDPEEALDILLVYADKVNFANLYEKVQKLTKKMFNKELPDFKTLIDTIFPKQAPEEEEKHPEETTSAS